MNIRTKERRRFQMNKFHLESIPTTELFKDVIIGPVQGNDLTLNYFELKNLDVKIPIHKHPVEHLVIVLEGKMEFIISKEKKILDQKGTMFVPANINHTVRVIEAPVKALEVYRNSKDEYYNG
jgi:quercetin dioxygenase-like cupin family protein